MSNTIRPTAAVNVPLPGQANQPQVPGMGQRAGMPGYAQGQMDPALQLRSYIEGSQQQRQGMGGTGAVRWEQFGDSRYEDAALREIRSTTGDEDVNRFYVQKYAAASMEFLGQLLRRQGAFYDEYRAVLEHFRLNAATGTPCEIRNEFVNTLNRYPEILRGIAEAAAPMFAQRLINVAKNTPNGEVGRKEYFDAAIFSIRCTLVMEMLAWLCKHPAGRQFVYRLTPEINKWIANIESYKDTFSVACNTLGLSSPYAGLVWDVKQPGRTDAALVSEASTAFMYQDFTRTQGTDTMPQSPTAELQEWVRRNAQATRNRHAPPPPNRPMEPSSDLQWNKVRTDFNNLTPQNRDAFELRQYFHNIGKPNHYFITESDWKKIQKAYTPHEEQTVQEETVLRGCFRVVIIDLDKDNGWFSTVVRAEGLSVTTLLTNPEKLLPFLEADDHSGMVNAVSLEKAVGDSKKLEIPVETCNELEGEGIPLIYVSEEIAETSSKKLMATAITSAQELTQNMDETSAVSFNAVNYTTFVCDSEADKTRLFHDLPFLFKDAPADAMKKPLSFYQRLKKLQLYFDEGIIGEELIDFISNRLTVMTNHWFISSLGYEHNENGVHISVGNIISDFDDLDKILETDDPEAYHCFNAPGDGRNLLTEAMKMFRFENPYEAEEDGGLIREAQKKRELLVERQMYLVVINRRMSPEVNANSEPLLIKRSRFPELFDLVEKGFEPTMGDLHVESTDKVLHFQQGDKSWLFTYSAYDINVATLRHITRRQELVYLPLV